MAVTNADLEKKLDEVLKKQQEILEADARRDVQYAETRKKVDDHEATLNGNGKEGLKTQVARMSDKVGDMITRWNIAMGLVAAQAVGIVILILTHQLPGWNP